MNYTKLNSMLLSKRRKENIMKKDRIELLLESSFLFDPNIYMTVVVTIEGDISEDKICEAVKKTYTQNQTTMSKVVIDEQGKVYLEEMEETGCKVFVDKRDWMEILHENERKPFRLEDGELIRTFIIPRGEQKDIFLMAHHLSGDGGALMILAEDIFNNIDGKEVQYKQTKVITGEESMKRGNLNFLQKLGLKSLSQKWGEHKTVFGWNDYYKVHEEFWKNSCTDISFIEIEGSELDNLKADCKKLGVTINTYLVTKLMKEYYPDTKKLGIPISVRGEEKSISCLVSSATPHAQYDTNKEFVENLVMIDKAIKKDLKDDGEVYKIPQFIAISDPTLVCAAYVNDVLKNIESPQVEKMADILGLQGGHDRVNLGITNLREIIFPSDYNSFKVTNVIPVAPCIGTTENIFTISTFNGKMLIAETKIRKM